MKPEEDACGQAMWAYYNGKDAFEIIERDDGYFDVSNGPKIYFSSYKDWPLHQRRAMEVVKGRVLDIGCGAGRHSLYMQEKGFDVLGIDNSTLAIKICKLRGLRRAEVMSIEEVNFKPNSFDTIIMMGNNFGLFGSFKKAQRGLKRFLKMTSEHALIIAETHDPHKTDDPASIEYHEFNRKRGRMSGQARIRVRFGKYVTKWFDYLSVSKEEMKEILNGTGWEVKHFIDSQNSQYITIIGKKHELKIKKT